ncbi:chord-domain-containing protein [Xylona heveae TC161]|uniref:Chord-domain-containing protein n=1 Tax=Xylona heveae (strain CBS 132557 / TC161) TaxID=1328760 RepID=A0A165GJ91_XYLHT|nr:chord-domain-containing protein [Xylona heveae TC161]KZF22255.1 chord-domain-containing protein [Xylona heveae TC161]
MAKKCVHKGCGKAYDNETEECVYHPGPPVFHEGQKGWKCCKPRVLTFDEFLSIPPCTTGRHSEVDDTQAAKPATDGTTTPIITEEIAATTPEAPSATFAAPSGLETTSHLSAALPSRGPIQRPAGLHSSSSPAPPPESDSDDPTVPIPAGTTCRRRGCNASYDAKGSREEENCVYHPGAALFHEGSKGWTCCKRRVLEFEEFMKIGGCQTRNRHLFVGSGKGKDGKTGGEELLIYLKHRHDFYQTPTSVIASLFLKKIDSKSAKIQFSSSHTVFLDLPTTDNKRYKADVPLYGAIDTEKSAFKIMGTKLELTLVKADGTSWPVLRSDEELTGEIIQVGRAGRV